MTVSQIPLLTGVPEIVVLDVGIRDDFGAGVYSALREYAPVRVIGFHPSEEEARRLAGLAPAGFEIHAKAIGNGGAHACFLDSETGDVCFYETDRRISEVFDVSSSGVHLLAPASATVQLDDLDEAIGADFLRIHRGGSALDVIYGAVETLQTALALHVSVELVPLLAGEPLFAEVDQKLRQCGFFFHKFAAFRRIALRGDAGTPSQIAAADALFLPVPERWSELEPDALLKLAAICHGAFGSPDFAARALSLFDARNGTERSRTYREKALPRA